MMKKRILILTLTLLFLVSTTGFPIYSHYCQMMEQKSLSKCEVCIVAMQKVTTSCCDEENFDEAITISSPNTGCCQDELVYNKVEDEFVNNKTDINFFSSSENLFQPISLLPPQVEFQTGKSFCCDSSPPFLINPELHITNSVFLI